MTADPLDRIAVRKSPIAWPGIVDMTVEERDALVEVARAARAVVDGKDWWDEIEVLRAALARLEAK